MDSWSTIRVCACLICFDHEGDWQELCLRMAMGGGRLSRLCCLVRSPRTDRFLGATDGNEEQDTV